MKVLSKIKECVDYLFFRIGITVSTNTGGASYSVFIIILVINNFLFSLLIFYNTNLRFPVIMSSEISYLYRLCMFLAMVFSLVIGYLLEDYYLELVEKYHNDSEKARNKKTEYVVLLIILSVITFACSLKYSYDKEKERHEKYLHDRWSPPKYYESDSIQINF